jgi:hypothetical protein
VLKTLSLIPQSKHRVRTAQQERHRRQGVLRVLHVLLDKQAHPVMNVLKESIVLDLITSQQFVVTVHKDTTKETKRKLPVFHAYQVSSVTKQVKANVHHVQKIHSPINQVKQIASIVLQVAHQK